MDTSRGMGTADAAAGRDVGVSIGRSALFGAAAGIVGGIVFGLMMQIMMPMMVNMIGSIIGMANPTGGWLYHLFNSAVIGAIFGLAVSRMPLSYATGALYGGLYGIIWWVLGPLILMPLMLGMSNMIFAINNDTLMSLVGHILFGVIMGVSYVALKERLASRVA